MVPGRVERVLSAALFLGFAGVGFGAGDAQAQTTISVGSAGSSDHGATLMLKQRVDRRVPRD